MTPRIALCMLLIALVAAGALAQPVDVETLITRLADGDATVRLESARELAKHGAEPLPKLLLLVGGEDQRAAAGARLAAEGIVA
ncbi:MAG: hypothetical protein FJX74_15340, partial [Armatimonadetes bacterium]|nr:hypothetical protein [Armatimonadota bacterium]